MRFILRVFGFAFFANGYKRRYFNLGEFPPKVIIMPPVYEDG